MVGMVLWLCGAPFALFGSVKYASSLVDTSAFSNLDAFDLMDWRTVLLGFVVLMGLWAVTLTVGTRLIERALRHRRRESAEI